MTGVRALALAGAWAIAMAGPLLGCHAPSDPAAEYAAIRSDFLHGSLDVAHARVEAARQTLARRAESGVGGGKDAVSDATWALKFRLLEAQILTYQGRSRQVLALLTDKQVAYPADGDAAIERLLLCGLAHAGLGDANQADQEVRAARRLVEASHSPLLGELLRTEALLQFRRNALVPANHLFMQSLQVARTQGDQDLEAGDLLNIGFVTLELKHYDEALRVFSEAAALAGRIGARTVVEAALGNVGWAYYNLGDFERALTNFQQAEREARQIGTTSAQIDWLQDAGMADFKLGDLQHALDYDEQALVAAQSVNASGDIVDIETELAFLLLRQGRDAQAQQHLDAANLALHPGVDEAAGLRIRLLQALLLARSEPDSGAERLLASVHADAGHDPALRWEIENALAHVHEERHDARQAEQWYRRSIDTFDSERSSVTDEALKLSFFANGTTLYQDYAEFLVRTQRSEQALKLLDRGRARTLEEGLGAGGTADVADPSSVARRLGATILFYSLGQDKSYLWAVTANTTRLFVLPPQALIEALLRDHRKAILRSSDLLHGSADTGQALYEILIAPAAAMLGNGSKVMLVPDGLLHELNFDTLVRQGDDGPHYWIEDVSVSVLSSIRMQSAASAPAPTDASDSLLLIGDPVTKGTGFDDLPNAGTEVERIQRYFSSGSQTVLTRSRAAPAAYARSDPGLFAYIHFVAHGTASRTSPLESAVVLSPAADDPADFKLYARDIVRYPLHARLVTVSACDGAGLRAYDGEGLVGLSWAFLRAGAHNVISALWEVDDAATLQLMDRLYRELTQGAAPEAALRTAKLSLLHSTGTYRKPLYWGAFQLYTGASRAAPSSVAPATGATPAAQ